MSTIRTRLGIATAALAVAGALTPLAAPAQAARGDCPWPYVCTYNGGGVKTGAWQDVTSGWQWMSARTGSVYNSRHDDVVYLLDTNGTVGCVEPGRTGDLPTPVVGLRISWEARCFG
ncbi:hypothetical protein JK358_37735 [Nocardia sp. 2]|uniref:Peptidase inhibitor family I36 n=1 Tax=Nocardia acididurans TaxID=2802282 RepID=A0ABS1MHW9_9NOCA|nr:hypothetical protein [Nocardia acididurans]MBL1080152.1 hypothetical protein [Nocardia acididurans]